MTATRQEWYGYALAVTVLLFLFVGLYKDVVHSPVDMTLVALGLMGLATLPFVRGLLSQGTIHKPLAVLLIAVTAWVAFRLLPHPSAWGVRKLVEMVALGIPAVVVGIVVTAYKPCRTALMNLLAWSAIPAVIWLAWSAFNNPHTFTTLGSGSYQHTGLYLSFSMVAAAASRKPILLALAATGCILTGHVSGVVFGTIATTATLAWCRDWRTAAWAAVLATALIGAYSVAVAPPVTVSRIITKIQRMDYFLERKHEAVARPFTTPTLLPLDTSESEPASIAPSKADPSVSAAVQQFDRPELYRAAVRQFAERPIFGWGYGRADYTYSSYPHNALLELGAETGIVGLLLGIAIFAVAGVNVVRRGDAFALGIFVLLSLTAMVSGYFGSRYLMFALGCAAAGAFIELPAGRKIEEALPVTS